MSGRRKIIRIDYEVEALKTGRPEGGAGLVRLATTACDRSGGTFPVRLTRIGLDGTILESVEA